MPVERDDYALVVGINDYPKYGKEGRPLRGAISDAQSFRDWLVDKKTGGGLPDDNCKLIVSSMLTVDPPQPRKTRVDDVLGELWDAVRARVASGNPPRRFYLYFSGHGQAQLNEDVALCLPNWAKDRQQAALSFRQYLSFVVNCIAFREVVVIMDCCRARRIGAKGLDPELSCAKPHEDAGKTETFVVHATEFQALSFEAGADGEDGEEPLVRGHLTEALLAGLRGGASRPEGGVPASRLHAYLKKVVPRIALRYGHEQGPKVEPFGIAPGDPAEPIFGTAPPVASTDVRISFKAGRAGVIRLEGPDLQVIREADQSTGPWDETLPLGTYLLTHLPTGETQGVHLVPAEGVVDVQF